MSMAVYKLHLSINKQTPVVNAFKNLTNRYVQ